MRRARRGLSAFAAILCLLTAASGEQTQPNSGLLRDTLREILNSNHVPGAQVAILRGENVQVFCLGERQTKPSLPVQADTIFEAASLSKPLFAFAVLKSSPKLKLDLDAPLIRYLGGEYVHWDNPFKSHAGESVTDPQLAKVTARMVLTHMSGLPNWARGPLRFESDPGTNWSYSSEGFIFLQRVVEKLSGEPLDRFLQHVVFEPLRMMHSGLVWRDDFADHFATGYNTNGKPDHLGPYRDALASSTLYTTAEDYARFVTLFLRDPVVVTQITANPVSVEPGINLYWGLGWGIEKNRRRDYLFHWGSNPGFSSFAMMSPHSGDGVIILTNSDNGTGSFEAITKLVLGGDHPIFRFRMLRPTK